MNSTLPPSGNDTIKIVSSSTDLPPGGAGAGLTVIKEHDEESDNNLHKQYENMTYDEIAQRMADNYKELTDMMVSRGLTPSSTTSSSDNSNNNTNGGNEDDEQLVMGLDIMDNKDDDLDEQQIVDNVEMDEPTKRTKMTKLFWRAASSGDSDKVRSLLQNEQYNKFVDIDAKDDDGTTPLIYAACFGKADIAQLLLSSGAKIDIQDSFGWSALMWATNNNQEQLVKILLEHGASSQTKSAKGRTVFDFVNTDNQKIVDILATNPRDSISSTSSIFGRNGSSQSSSSSNAGDYDFYYQSTVEGYDSFMTEEAERRRKLLESAMNLGANDLYDGVDMDDFDQYDNGDGIGDNDDEDDTNNNDFQWDKCLPDQMFVFGADDLPYILDTIITNIQLPMRSQHEICIPANVIFLSSRFAHYFSTDELLNEVMDGSLERMNATIKANARNVHVLAFWLTNLTQLLHYLKKDSGLVVATANHQLSLSELISETYTAVINDTERRIAKILGPAMLEHEEIPGMDDVNFTDDWHRFFRRSSRRSVVIPPDGALAVQMKRHMSSNNGNSDTMESTTNPGTNKSVAISPQSITSLLSSTLFVLQSYDVHPTIVVQALAQFFHYLSCELFNRILTNKKLLCRSKAMQIRMNLSKIEDWICANHMPASLASYLNPTTQLLQLLQCLTQLTDLVSFINTVKSFDVLNALQVKRCVVNYRYEVNEPRLPEEIEKYAMQLAEDTVRHRQARHQTKNTEPSIPIQRQRHSSMSLSRSHSISMQRSESRRRDSMSHLVGSFMSSMGISTSLDSAPQQPKQSLDELPLSPVDMKSTKNEDEANDNDNDDDDDKEIKETKDSKFMLPFSVPTSTTGQQQQQQQQQHLKHEHFVKERLLVPIIPEDWMKILDKGHLTN
ncbi:hypothetical protein BC941DRAFT_467856 [Chlamydoabsidia padenii]|nr:hypothetical protein BC941DRAFT_467856 [Chlamydoabsidia padenii]